MKQGIEIKCYWFKIRNSVHDNEAADRLAKAGAELDVVNDHVDVPPSYVKHFLAQKILRTWQDRWDEEYRGRSIFHALARVSETRT